MSRYDDGWPAYVPVAERRRLAARAMARLAKRGHPVAPVKIEGRAITTTFWGNAWCDNLESYRDLENRLKRGRSYVRNGAVVDLQIAPREVNATVSGSSLYRVTVNIDEVPKKQWTSICADCAGGIDSLVELLQGRLSKGVMERICRQGGGLFPKPSEIRFACSCPDYASMCKHVAAVLYGIGARLDGAPELLFCLRAVNENDLVAQIEEALPLTKQSPAAGKVLETDDVAALFGLDMAAVASEAAPLTLVNRARPRPGGKAMPNKSARSSAKVAATAVEVPGSSRKAERPTAKTPVPERRVKATKGRS
jgi:uncharacterized Zn finger protein